MFICLSHLVTFSELILLHLVMLVLIMAPSLSIRFNCTDVISVYICLILFSFFDENCFKDLSTTDQFKSMGISKAKASDADCAEL